MTRNEISNYFNTNILSKMTGFWSSETLVMLTFATLVGSGAGIGTVIFIHMISLFNTIFFGYGKALPFPGGTYVIILPIIGGLIVGLLIQLLPLRLRDMGFQKT